MNKKTKKILKVSTIVFLSLVVLIGVAIGGVWFYFSDNAANGAIVYINKGSNAKIVHDSLAVHVGEEFASKVIKVADYMKVDWAKRAGVYKIQRGQSVVDVARMFSRGAQIPVKFTFNNVRTIDELAEIVDDKLMMSADEFKKAVYDEKMLKRYGLTKDNVSVMFTPDTYEFYWSVTPDAFIKTMYNYYDKWWTVDRKSKADKYGLTPAEMGILASIVEEETNCWEERGTVGRLYLNRIQKGMLLQADPTVKFALYDLALRNGSKEDSEEIFARRRITKIDCDTADSPYNTYKYAGLPPGPIRLADKRTIDAVLKAKSNDYLYMCAKEDFSGRHNFAKTLSQHNANARRYHAALNARGIR